MNPKEKSGPSPYRTALRNSVNQSISVDVGEGKREQHLEIYKYKERNEKQEEIKLE